MAKKLQRFSNAVFPLSRAQRRSQAIASFFFPALSDNSISPSSTMTASYRVLSIRLRAMERELSQSFLSNGEA
jgi:hypothetical protein